MNVAEYCKLSSEAGYIEDLDYVTGLEVSLQDFLDYSEMDIDLKKHLVMKMLCRSFYGTYMAFFQDVDWFIRSFFEEYIADPNYPWMTSTIKEAAYMVLSNERPKQTISICYLFTTIENYTKYFLGFRPSLYNFGDPKRHEYLKLYNENRKNGVTLERAVEILQHQTLPISKALNEIEMDRIQRLQNRVSEDTWTRYRIGKRIGLARNPMLHGERIGFSEMGYYLLMIYILYYFHDPLTKVGSIGDKTC